MIPPSRQSQSLCVNAGIPDRPPGTDPPDVPANGVFLDRVRAPQAGCSLQLVRQHDGVEHTLLLSENVDARHWYDVQEPWVGFVWVPDGAPGVKPWRINQNVGRAAGTYRAARPSSFHPDGVNVAYCDGRVGFMHRGIDPQVLASLMTVQDEEAGLPGPEDRLGQR